MEGYIINIREYQRGNQKWTIQRNWQHKVHRTNKCQRIPKGQSKKDNPEKLATQGTQDEEKQNNKTTTQYVLDTTIRWTPLYAYKHK